MPDGRRPSPNAVALIVLVALLLGLVAWQRPWSDTADPGQTALALPADADRLLVAQLRDLGEASSADEFRQAAGSTEAAAVFADQAWQGRAALGVTEVAFRRVSGGTVADAADGSTTAVVEVRWSAAADSPLGERSAETSRVRMRLDPASHDALAVRSVVAADGEALPLWLAGDIDVRDTDDVVIVSIDGGGVERIAERGATAHAAVVQVIEPDHPRLVIIDPPDAAGAAAVMGRQTGELGQIAAVATLLGASPGERAVVVLNPDAFSVMDDRATQIVVTHEATHVMTGAVGVPAEIWVTEGFADFVALRDDTAPLSVSAGQILASVRTDGPPAALPVDADFDGAAHGLGAIYESVWLIFRMLAENNDEDDIVRFYTAVLDGVETDDALRDVVGTTRATLTEQWRDYLTNKASTVS